MLLTHLKSQRFEENLIFAQVTTPTPVLPTNHSNHFSVELWTAIAILGVSALTLFRQEIQRFNKHREQEAQQAVAYVAELKDQNSKLEQEVKVLRNQVMGLRVRLGLVQSQKEEISSGELRRRGPREY